MASTNAYGEPTTRAAVTAKRLNQPVDEPACRVYFGIQISGFEMSGSNLPEISAALKFVGG
jgi:hypothetical protein